MGHKQTGPQKVIRSETTLVDIPQTYGAHSFCRIFTSQQTGSLQAHSTVRSMPRRRLRDDSVFEDRRNLLAEEALTQIEDICNEHEIKLDFIPQLIGLSTLQTPIIEEPQFSSAKNVSVPRYFMVKRFIDLCLSLLMIVIFMPVLILVAILVLLDVGSPVFYWQRRIGMNGQIFQVHKFRTMKPAYDWRGRAIGTTERISWVGAVIRKFRLDELPQLLNVLVGDMSLIGPRPLLPHDQPPDPTLRLMVRPGITGWAQINGGPANFTASSPPAGQ